MSLRQARLATLLFLALGTPAYAAPPVERLPPSPFIKQDRGGLDIAVGKDGVVLSGYYKTPGGPVVKRRQLAIKQLKPSADTRARDSFRAVRNRILVQEHFPFSEKALLEAAMDGATVAAQKDHSLDALYTAATDAMVKELQKVDRWSRVETVEEHVARTTPAANNVTAHRFPHDVVMVKVRRFRGPISQQVQDAITEAKKDGAVKGIILDLRNNGGGAVSEARSLLSRFLPAGQPLLTTEYGLLGKPTSLEVMTAVAHPEGHDTTTPIVLLVNGKSASASELTSGVFKDLGRVTVFGDKTFGKGVGQRGDKLPDGRMYQLTGWRRRLATLGTYHGIGIEPDVSTAAAHSDVAAAAQKGLIRARGDQLLRGALLHLWEKQQPENAPN